MDVDNLINDLKGLSKEIDSDIEISNTPMGSKNSVLERLSTRQRDIDDLIKKYKNPEGELNILRIREVVEDIDQAIVDVHAGWKRDISGTVIDNTQMPNSFLEFISIIAKQRNILKRILREK